MLDGGGIAGGRLQRGVGARHPPHDAAWAAIVAEAGRKGKARGGGQRDGAGEVVGGRGGRLGLHLGGHRWGVLVARRRGFSLVLAGGVEGGLAAKGQADGGSTNDSGSGTKLDHGSASVMGAWCNERREERRRPLGTLPPLSEAEQQRRQAVKTNGMQGQAARAVRPAGSPAQGHRKGSVVTVGTVFILDD